MAYVTRNLGFGVTCAVSYEHPYTLARRFSTLDHLTGGRIGWNVVTGYLNSAAKGIGLARQPEHDTRYEIAEEYMQIVYKLWEGSWEDGAALRDRTQRVFARPEKVHRIRHNGRYFQIEAIHLCEPSPQRTPLIYQAGASSRGRQFAATHAECVFINGPSKQVIAPIVTGHSPASRGGGPQPRRNFDFHDDDRDHRGDFRRRPSEARGLPCVSQDFALHDWAKGVFGHADPTGFSARLSVSFSPFHKVGFGYATVGVPS